MTRKPMDLHETYADARVSPRAHDTARLLVVEDDPSSRRGLELLLTSAGYDTTAAADAEEALAKVRSQHFDLEISDVNLPGMNGYQLTTELRGDGPHRHTPIILVSAVADPQRRVTGLDCGADDFLAKPVDFDELLARVRLHLRHAAREQELKQRCRRDSVAGVLNRYGIDEELVREFARSRRSATPLAIVMVDIDDFKAINDRYGHTCGDEALRIAAARLDELVRISDRVGRYGGDEFLIILPDTTRDEAEAFVKRMRTAWDAAPPCLASGSVPICVSFGCASAEIDEGVVQLVRRADEEMYRDKRRTSRRHAGSALGTP